MANALPTQDENNLILKIQKRIQTGAYSDIFRSADGTKVFKLFINCSHPTNVSQWLTMPEHDKQRRDTFDTECDAYEIALKHPSILLHVPHFYGRVEISDVLDQEGNSVACHYLLDCCYAIEYLDGDDVKLGSYSDEDIPPHLRDFIMAMQAVGIAYVKDASVFMPDDAEGFKIIDFATREVEPPVYDV